MDTLRILQEDCERTYIPPPPSTTISSHSMFPQTPSTPYSPHTPPRHIAKLLQALSLVGDLAFVVESIQEDVRDAVEQITRNARAHLADTTCRIDLAVRWINSHHATLDGYVAQFDKTRDTMALFGERVQATVDLASHDLELEDS